MIFWTSAAQVAAKMDQMRAVEARLLQYARRFAQRHPNTYEMNLIDTRIPRSVVPVRYHDYDIHEDQDDYLIHGVHVTSKSQDQLHLASDAPLVLLHGYMNASSYFYRNIIGLSRYFSSVYSLDMLGWGLSSRPNFTLIDDSIETAEDFFVESLEAWRVQNKLDKMILAGHSMSGYLSVAYCERYPQNVERLILISPVGVLDPSERADQHQNNQPQPKLRYRLARSFFTHIFNHHSVGDILRTIPVERGLRLCENYVQHRLPAITEPDEQQAVADYLYINNTLPGSGEYCAKSFLNSSIFAHKPTKHRIPKLQVDSVSFLYGEHDWMEASGGLQVQKLCEDQQQQAQLARLSGQHDSSMSHTPEVQVLQVSKAGHLLMLDNWAEFNSGIVLSSGHATSVLDATAPRPTRLIPGEYDAHASPNEAEKWRQRARGEQVTAVPAS